MINAFLPQLFLIPIFYFLIFIARTTLLRILKAHKIISWWWWWWVVGGGVEVVPGFSTPRPAQGESFINLWKVCANDSFPHTTDQQKWAVWAPFFPHCAHH